RGPTTDGVHDAGTGEVHVRTAERGVLQLEEPATTPGPVAEDRVDEGTDQEAPDDEGLPRPTLSHGAREDRRGGVHEHHLEEEQDRDARVERLRAEEEALVAEEPPGRLTDGDRRLLVEHTDAGAEVPGAADPTEHDREAADPEADHAQAV